jgi:hypothetical protein
MKKKHQQKNAPPRSPEYIAWSGMKQRCNNPKCKGYPNYGGRGIRVCDRWADSYLNFLADMGRRPKRGYSLDRINNDGHYEPGNCRWADAKEQAANKRAQAKRPPREKPIRAVVSLDKKLLRAARITCVKKETTLSKVVEKALEEWLGEEK